MYFHEWYDVNSKKLKLELAHCFASEEVWVKKYDLTELGYTKDGKITSEWDDIREDFQAEGKKPIAENAEDPLEFGCFHESVNRIRWDKFENVWLPVPFFLLHGNVSEFGPTNWCRGKLVPVDTTGKSRTYDLLLAFDTRTLFEQEDFEDEDLNETPVFTSDYDRSKEYALCNNEYKLIGYCSEELNCDWVDKYVLKHVHGLDDINEYQGKKPKMSYLAQYIYIMRYIYRLGILPKITLYSNKNVASGNVDLVVDIGNSRTCAVLFDNGDFTKTSPLELQDLTLPVSGGILHKYRDSFDMRLAFREADFGGKFGIDNSRQFVYPSMVRLGKEADRLIHKAINMNTGAEKTSTFSSPKRFLWDHKPQKQE